jgi:hypothetical protein
MVRTIDFDISVRVRVRIDIHQHRSPKCPQGHGCATFCRTTLHGMRSQTGPYFTKVKGYPANPKTIGEAIRKRRLDCGLRQIDVGVDPNTLAG